MTIFNDATSTSEQEEEMKALKDGVEKAKGRMQEGRNPTPVEEPEKKPKPRSKRRQK